MSKIRDEHLTEVALADPNYEGTAAADAALGTRFNRAGEEANRKPIPVNS